jgi:hypothetical protein
VISSGVADVLRSRWSCRRQGGPGRELLDSVGDGSSRNRRSSRIKTARRAGTATVGSAGDPHGPAGLPNEGPRRQERGVEGERGTLALPWAGVVAAVMQLRNSFVGRGEELIALQALLARTRSPSSARGCGKTAGARNRRRRCLRSWWSRWSTPARKPCQRCRTGGRPWCGRAGGRFRPVRLR